MPSRPGPAPFWDVVNDGSFGGTSYRVYTPAEIRSAPLRTVKPPPPARGRLDFLKSGIALAQQVGLGALFKWVGLGVVIGALALGALVVLLALVDDTPAKSSRQRATMAANDARVEAEELPERKPAPAPVVPLSLTDFELVDSAPNALPAGVHSPKSPPVGKAPGRKKKVGPRSALR